VVVHLRAPLPLQDLQLRDLNLVKSVLPAEVVQTALVQHVKFLKVAKSAIHVGFGPLHKNAISREFVRASLNQTFLKTLQVRSSRRVFVQNF
jgi:hypothetical protein